MADPQVRAITNQLERFAERFIKKLTLDINANLVETTPVDTGWARANWVATLTQPATDVVGSPEAVSTSEQSSGQSKVATYTLAKGRIFITNNVPYIIRLNDGSSSQAPSGFIEAAIQKALTQDLLGLTA